MILTSVPKKVQKDTLEGNICPPAKASQGMGCLGALVGYHDGVRQDWGADPLELTNLSILGSGSRRLGWAMLGPQLLLGEEDGVQYTGSRAPSSLGGLLSFVQISLNGVGSRETEFCFSSIFSVLHEHFIMKTFRHEEKLEECASADHVPTTQTSQVRLLSARLPPLSLG